MFSLVVESDDEAKDLLSAELWEQGTTGIVESELTGGGCLLRAFFEPEADAASLLRRFGGRIERHAERDWVAHSRENWAPLAVGARFYLVPRWRDDPAPAGRIRIEINPGLACGSGFHEATQLCLEALEKYQRPHMTVADIGAGSAILSIASAGLGAQRVIACDVDPVAVAIAGENLQRAGAEVLLFNGSAGAIASGSVDLMVVNINAPVSIELAPDLLRCLAPGGRCVAGGFEAHEAAAVESALESAGAAILERLAKAEWRALVITRTP